MEKIESICMMHGVMQAISLMERQLNERFGLTMNEAMFLCCVGKDTLSASTISQTTCLTPSHASKVLRSVEKKGYLRRTLGKTDKRLMNFTLTPKGLGILQSLHEQPLEVPELLQPLLLHES